MYFWLEFEKSDVLLNPEFPMYFWACGVQFRCTLGMLERIPMYLRLSGLHSDVPEGRRL